MSQIREEFFKDLANFMDVQINELEKVRKSLNIDPREHDPEYAWCEECQEYYHESTHLWKGDLALCPKCESNLEL
jgi:Zn finger protein HypA/HybF involved in hydrogenase expression